MSTFRRSRSIEDFPCAGASSTCFSLEVGLEELFDGDGTGEASRAIEACRGVAFVEVDSRLFGGVISIGFGLNLEGPSPLSAILTVRIRQGRAQRDSRFLF